MLECDERFARSATYFCYGFSSGDWVEWNQGTAGRAAKEKGDAAVLEITKLQTEYRTNPLGLDERKPAFSWALRSDGRNIRQASCRIVVTKGE